MKTRLHVLNLYTLYRQVFNEQFNIAFHHPNKDICGACTKFSLSSNLTAVQQNEHKAHIRRKVQARESKDRDKKDESLVVAAFDLQQVLTCPKISVSSSYYSRKLNLYNFRPKNAPRQLLHME